MNTEKTPAEQELERELKFVCNTDVETLIIKGRSYGNSWKKRGGIGAFMMLARKWDRIEEAVKNNGYDVFSTYGKDARDEGIIDDIRDLRRYLLLVEVEVTFKHANDDPWSLMAREHAREQVSIKEMFDERPVCSRCKSPSHHVSDCPEENSNASTQ